jgi:hypothetical protein
MTAASEAPLPLPDLCVTALKIRKKQQDAARARAGPAPSRDLADEPRNRCYRSGAPGKAKSAPIWKLQVWLPRNLPEPERSSPLTLNAGG